jgi:hypothetical protein
MKLARFEERWAEAAMGAIFPGAPGDGFGDIRGMDLRGFLRQVVAIVPTQAAVGLRVAVWLCALAPLFVIGKLSTLSGLAEADRERVVVRLAASRLYAIRSLVLILKTIGALLYAGDDAVRARMNAPRALAQQGTGLVTLHAKRVQAA